ncbi:MAG: peptidylprolyl isomerase [Planctomycetaceae bacterium]
MNRRVFLGLTVMCAAVWVAGCSEEPPAPPVMDVMNDMQALQEAAEAEALAKARAAAANAPAAGDDPMGSSGDVPQEGRFVVEFDTTVGSFTVEVDRSWAPIGADRFYKLVKDGYYDDAGFFRVVPNFMVQWGLAADPADTAKWDQSIMDDPVKQSNKRGYMTFAKTGAPNSRSTQVFVNYADNSFLDDQGFAPFGQVTKGMDVVSKISSAHGEEPDQGAATAEGNAYLKSTFPKLDYIKTARVIKDDQSNQPDAADGDTPEATAEPEATTEPEATPSPEAGVE